MSRRSRIERGCGDALVDLLDPDPILRRYAVDAAELDGPGLYALRERLLDDTHGPVRAAAAERLARAARASFDGGDRGPPIRADAAAWLLEALGDPLPSVREIVCRAVARHIDRDLAIERRLAAMIAGDPSWRVRRAAARALAAVAGQAGIPTLLAGLDDPFWRVRHAIVTALALIVAAADEPDRAGLREDILSAGASLGEAARAALAYLAGEWPEGEDDVPAVLGIIRDPGAGLELADADPAVVTARLQAAAAAAAAIDPDELVPLLAESHVPLREEAARRLAKIEDPRCLIPALAWLEDPRVPNAPAVVLRLLERLGRRAAPLAEHALAHGRAGSLAWAASWVGVHPAEHLHGRLLAHACHPHEVVRAAVVTAAGRVRAREPEPEPELEELAEVVARGLGDPHPLVRDAAALARVERPGSGPPIDVEIFASLGPRARAIVAGLGRDPTVPTVHAAALADADARVRVAAWRADPGASTELRARAQADADPWVRGAALDLRGALEVVLGDGERDPGVRRLAAREVVRSRVTLGAEQLAAVGARLRDADDPWLRARAAELVDPRASDCADELAHLLAATRDRAAMVRVSAAGSLDLVPGLADRLERLLAHNVEVPALRIAAWSRLVAELEPDLARATIEAALSRESAEVAAHLRELAVVFGAEPPAPALEPSEPSESSESSEPSDPSEPSDRPAAHPGAAPARPVEPELVVARRPLGRTGIELAPLVISGAFSPTPSSLATAVERGVDTLFWEPRYASLTRFLRQPRRRGVQVVAGSFHADRRAITHDLELALRRLRRDHIDLFLLFWVRSPARLSAEALDALRDLQAAGKVRSFGFSTHDRAIACAAIATGDWPVVMTRHSAAHDGAEHELLLAAAAAGVGVLSFSALCYGRMLRPSGVFEAGPAAADCYRYSLAQPAVAACVSAPQRHRELVENLAVLDQPDLAPEHAEALRAHGKEIYADNKRFDRLVRRGGTAPLREAILELFEQAYEPGEAEPTAGRSGFSRGGRS